MGGGRGTASRLGVVWASLALAALLLAASLLPADARVSHSTRLITLHDPGSGDFSLVSGRITVRFKRGRPGARLRFGLRHRRRRAVRVIATGRRVARGRHTATYDVYLAIVHRRTGAARSAGRPEAPATIGDLHATLVDISRAIANRDFEELNFELAVLHELVQKLGRPRRRKLCGPYGPTGPKGPPPGADVAPVSSPNKLEVRGAGRLPAGRTLRDLYAYYCDTTPSRALLRRASDILGHDVGPINAGNNEQLTLKVTKSGTGTGTVFDNFNEINCGNDCEGTYAQNTTVVLNTTPANDSTFTKWGGPDGKFCGTDPGCKATMSKDLTIDAEFTRNNLLGCRTTQETDFGSGQPNEVVTRTNCASSFNVLRFTPKSGNTIVAFRDQTPEGSDCTGGGSTPNGPTPVTCSFTGQRTGATINIREAQQPNGLVIGASNDGGATYASSYDSSAP